MTIGYLMFGQISNLGSREELRTLLKDVGEHHGFSFEEDISESIPRKTRDQIRAAAKIMEACTHYAILSQAVGLKRQQFSRMLNQYLLAHLSESLSAQRIAEDLDMSRSKLYMECQQYLGMGIGEYLKSNLASGHRVSCDGNRWPCRFCRLQLFLPGISAGNGDIPTKIQERTAKEQELFHNQGKGIYTIDIFTKTKRNAALNKEIKQLQQAEADLLRRKAQGNQQKQATAQIIPTTQHILENYTRLNTLEKNQLWKLVMKKATVYRSPDGEVSLHIYPNIPK